MLMNGEKSKEGRKKGRRYKKWNNKVSRVSGEGKRSVLSGTKKEGEHEHLLAVA